MLYSRAKRPEDLPPIISDVYKIWQTSAMHLSVIAGELGVSKGAVYRWLQGMGSPPLSHIDSMLQLLGYHLEVVADHSSTGRRLREAALANKPEAPPDTERAERPADLHPVLLQTYQLLRGLGVSIRVTAAGAGISQSTAYNWFMGHGLPNVVVLDEILRLYGYRLKAERGVRVKTRTPAAAELEPS
jgi:transcriptional regulator with XRE-family HTH domain